MNSTPYSPVVPPSLKKGDRVSIVAPAGNLRNPKLFQDGCAIIKEMGFEVVVEQSWTGDNYLAGTDRERLLAFNRAWTDPEIKAIFSLRGGYGSLRLLPYLDHKLIRKNPKWFVGFSDITILHYYLQHFCGLISLHGPVVTTLAGCDQDSIARLYHCLVGGWHTKLEERVEIIRSGPSVEGVLVGGNLSSLVSMLGTPWEPDFTNSILFLEDVGESMYRLDRLLTQLFLTGKLDKTAGIILGDFTDQTEEKNELLRKQEFVWNRLLELTSSLDMPIWGGFPLGHRFRNVSLPLGAAVRMNHNSCSLSFRQVFSF